MNKEIGDGYTINLEGVVTNKNGKILTPQDNGKGYLIISLYINGKRTVKAIHRLLAEAFIPNPLKLSDVDHIDGNRRNNSLENLRWLTHGQNIKHAFYLENRSAKGTSNARCKTDENTVHSICKLLQEGFSSAKIRDFGFDYSLVRAIKSRKNWNFISDNYSW